MSDTFAPVKIFSVTLLFWILLNGALEVDVLLVGAVVAGAITFLLAGSLSFLSGYRLTWESARATLGYLGYFLRELLKANLSLARVVMDPALPVEPAIVKVRTRLKNPVARLLLANSITLTPGTLTVEMKGEWLYVHWVFAKTTDPNVATAEIVADFEKFLEKMYD
ncbi:Na+/H+ antiporter subunit E [Tropicimonas sediminicola]|uniref:Multicomponent Na+:H+ antiporter subunit E n=1 Tax=Tropicimonas sediminicola TaxID=1031541 RepID=A0A239LH52_9RHOB|nr:Na+/H+ antiporter subunit E [Tropicimonas sediminicola]SNT29946.1 multicomponent Na+:H+ antiporter subunit E [Tropicimonas sediminicola]